MNTSQKHGYAGGREKSSGLSTFKKFTIIAVAGMLTAVSVMTAASESKVAYITDGEQTYTVTTSHTDTSAIIEDAGIELDYYDKAVVTEESRERIDIDIIRSFPVKISIDGGARFINVTSGTVADALDLIDKDILANDIVTPALDTELESDMVITVTRGIKLYIVLNGERKLVYAPEGTVAEALSFLGYEAADDTVDVTAQIESGMELNVNKVLYRTTYKKSKLEPTVIEEACSDLPKGETKVKQEGKEGLVEIAYSEKYINNELAEKTESGKQVIIKPVDKIVLIGTKATSTDSDTDTDSETASDKDTDSSKDTDSEESSAKQLPEVSVQPAEEISSDETEQEEPAEEAAEYDFGRTQDTYGDGISYSSLIIGSCTAYYEVDGITATGTVPQVGTVAVNPNVIPYGTRLYICSADGSFVYGYAIAEDTGGACMAGDIVVDLYMNSEEECNAFGRQELYIYVLN